MPLLAQRFFKTFSGSPCNKNHEKRKCFSTNHCSYFLLLSRCRKKPTKSAWEENYLCSGASASDRVLFPLGKMKPFGSLRCCAKVSYGVSTFNLFVSQLWSWLEPLCNFLKKTLLWDNPDKYIYLSKYICSLVFC